MSKAVYVCLEEAGPMFGHLYGFGSFLASPRGTMVASESEVLSSEAHVVGEKSAGSKPGALEEEWGKCDAFPMPACCRRPPSASRRDLHSAFGGWSGQPREVGRHESDTCRVSWVASRDWVTSQQNTQSEEGSLQGGERRAVWCRTSLTLALPS